MKLTIKILSGRPDKVDLHKIIDMICEGYRSGIDQPAGVNWELESDTATYNYLQKLVDGDIR